jgi:hypothetical protein
MTSGASFCRQSNTTCCDRMGRKRQGPAPCCGKSGPAGSPAPAAASPCSSRDESSRAGQGGPASTTRSRAPSHDRRSRPRHGTHRGALRHLRQPSRPCVRRRPAADGAALLHQRRGDDFRPVLTRRPARAARSVSRRPAAALPARETPGPEPAAGRAGLLAGLALRRQRESQPSSAIQRQPWGRRRWTGRRRPWF